MRAIALLAGSIVGLGITGSSLAAEPKLIDFAHDIVPLLKARCAKCHTNGEYKGSFSLDTRDVDPEVEERRPRQEHRERVVSTHHEH